MVEKDLKIILVVFLVVFIGVTGMDNEVAKCWKCLKTYRRPIGDKHLFCPVCRGG